MSITSEQPNNTLHFSKLPVEAKLAIFSFCSPKELGKYHTVSKEWNKLLSDDHLWRGPIQHILSLVEAAGLHSDCFHSEEMTQKEQFEEYYWALYRRSKKAAYHQYLETRWQPYAGYASKMVNFVLSRDPPNLFYLLCFGIPALVFAWAFVVLAYIITSGFHINWGVPVGLLAALFTARSVFETIILVAFLSIRKAIAGYVKQYRTAPPFPEINPMNTGDHIIAISICIPLATYFLLLALKVGNVHDLSWWVVWLPLWFLAICVAVVVSWVCVSTRGLMNPRLEKAVLTTPTIFVNVLVLTAHVLIYSHLEHAPGLETWFKALAMVFALYGCLTVFLVVSHYNDCLKLGQQILVAISCRRMQWRALRQHSISSALFVIAPILGGVFLVCLAIKLDNGGITWTTVFGPLFGALAALTYVEVMTLIAKVEKSRSDAPAPEA